MTSGPWARLSAILRSFQGGLTRLDPTIAFGALESAVEKDLSNRLILGAAVAATDRTSETTRFAKAYGSRSIDDEPKPMEPDSVAWFASCTKLLTAICVLQCVERGLLDLDADVSEILPEWKSPDVLLTFDEGSGQPLTKKASHPITLRQLLTHSSGMGYDGMNPALTRYRKVHRGLNPPMAINSVAEDNTVILSFEPGHGWEYSPGFDWAGKMVERVHGGVRLGEYMNTHIFQPLGMSSTTFRMPTRPDLMARLCDFPVKLPGGGFSRETAGAFPVIDPVDDCGGGGVYSCATDYIKPLASLLRDDGKLLKPETAAGLFRPQLEDTKWLQDVLHGPMAPYLAPGMPSDIKWNYALGGIVAVEGIEDQAGKGTLYWWGLPNSYWFIDRERGTCGVYVSQILPSGDKDTAALNLAFQKDVYKSDW